MIGTRLSRYRIVEELGRGGMGCVYRAHDELLDREIALKVLNPDLGGQRDEQVRRLLGEARALASIDHPGITAIYEIDTRDGQVFIAMELVQGARLSDLVAKGKLTTARVVEIAIDVAETLAAVHQRGMIHRDVKPSNILVTPKGRARVVDFGLARRADTDDDADEPVGEAGDSAVRTEAGVVVGSAPYLSPEQVLGRPLDGRSDMFGFGSVLFEALTGERAFPGRSLETVLRGVALSPTPVLADVREGPVVSALLRKIVETCLEKAPEDRFPGMTEVVAELRAVLAAIEPDRVVAGGRPALRALVVDDVEMMRATLREQLKAHPDVVVVGECADGFEAVKATNELRPDLVFLDVQMPKLDGFEVLDLVARDVAVIFVTAHDEFAMQAMDSHAVDYLLKPVEPERLRQALVRARTRLRQRERAPAAALLAATRKSRLERLLVRQAGGIHVIPVTELEYVRARRSGGILLHCVSAEFAKSQTIDEFAARLDPKLFARIHPSYLVNVDRLQEVVPPRGTRGAVVTLADGTRIEASAEGYHRLRALLD